MRKLYQIDCEQVVRRFKGRTEESEQKLQLHLPLKEVAAVLQQGLAD